MSESVLQGGCACGAVTFKVSVPPTRAALCHCVTCRKAHASAFNPFVVFERRGVEIIGGVQGWESSLGYVRYFCPRCGSRVFALSGDEVEISMGSFDDIGAFSPGYETWVIRREPWLPPLAAPQFPGNRTGPRQSET